MKRAKEEEEEEARRRQEERLEAQGAEEWVELVDDRSGKTCSSTPGRTPQPGPPCWLHIVFPFGEEEEEKVEEEEA